MNLKKTNFVYSPIIQWLKHYIMYGKQIICKVENVSVLIILISLLNFLKIFAL